MGEKPIPLKASQSNSLTEKTSVTKMRGKSACCQSVAGILKGKVINCTQSDRVREPGSHIYVFGFISLEDSAVMFSFSFLVMRNTSLAHFSEFPQKKCV